MTADNAPAIDTAPVADRAGLRVGPPMWLFVLVAVGGAIVDQVSKFVAVDVLYSGPLHFGIVHVRLVANRGIFMGMASLPTWGIALGTLVVVGISVAAVRRSGNLQSIALGLLVAGAVGNLVDRYAARPRFPSGAVVDWLSFGGMTFNLADVFIVAGLLVMFGRQADETGAPVEGGPPALRV